MESEGEFNMHDRVQNINGILKRIRQMNERDALRAIAYNGDTKFVRVEKRLTEQSDREERSIPNLAPMLGQKERAGNGCLASYKRRCRRCILPQRSDC